MRVAILHYHLKPGGVTRVIENTVRELEKVGVKTLVFCSETPAKNAYPFDNVRVVPGLAYCDTFSLSKAGDLKRDLETACKKEWGKHPDVWHIHNHSLAKNLELPVVVSQWAEEGQKMLLHLHDFAEDGRPDNYKSLLITLAEKDTQKLNRIIYPTGDHIAYAFINGRDRSFFTRAGVNEEQCHLLANPVWLDIDKDSQLEDSKMADKRLYLYPTRAIRRKNLGELLLWSAASSGDELFASTMALANPTALPIYKRWVAIAERLNLPVRFGLGEQHSFDSLLNSAYSLITTSIAEGFGLAYLEPYLIGAQLVGRDLPDITRDFAHTGIQLNGLYPRLDIPIAWVGKDRLRKTVHEALVRYYQSYRQPFSKPMTERALDTMVHGDLVDFGCLDEPMQKTVIELVAENPSLKLDFAPEKLDRLLSEKELGRNYDAIVSHFNPLAYSKALSHIYSNLANATSSQAEYLDTVSVLNCFLDPRRFNLLRT